MQKVVEVWSFNGFVTSLPEDFFTVKLKKPWLPEVFLECYCVEGNLKPIRYEKTKSQAPTVISLY